MKAQKTKIKAKKIQGREQSNIDDFVDLFL